MTQEEKKLFIVATCGYLPHKIILVNDNLNGGYPTRVYPGYLGLGQYLDSSNINETKMFLRPMSSMTGKEQKAIYKKCGITTINIDGVFELIMPTLAAERLIDFYEENHLDYRGLIPMGLALEAPEDMYKTE